MHPTHFDRFTQALAAGMSRRQVLVALSGALLARISGFERSAARLRSQTVTPAAGPLQESAPLYVSAEPIPLGGSNFLIDGSIISLDLEAVPFVEETPSVPINIPEPDLVNERTVFIDTTSLQTDLQPGATPAAGAATPSAGEASSEAKLETLCGFDDSEDVELYRGDLGVSKGFVADHQLSVGLIRWNATLFESFANPGTVNARRWCSGTLISEDLFLTAGHCFAQDPDGWIVPRIDGTNDPISRTEIALNMHVDFRYQLDASGNDQVPMSVPIIELVEDRLGDQDYAIVRLANNPGLTFGLTAIAAADAAPGQMLCIMGHPEGVPKRIEAGPLTKMEANTIQYDDIDTRGGNSGSGILADPGGQIVGVHTTGGCGVSSGTNRGVRISALLNSSPILRSLAAGEAPVA
jgi:V8-like Glu-specific endopeptidase